MRGITQFTSLKYLCELVFERFCEECDSEEFIPWDYETKKCPQCKDGIIDESDEGVLIMAD